jgi:glycosyltransferase involved in cell wall biosynthesis
MSYCLAQSLANDGRRVVFISHKPFFSKPFRENIDKGELLVYSWPTENRPVKISDALWYAKIYLKYKPSIVISHFVNVNITTIVSKILSLGRVKTLPYYHTLSSQINEDVSVSSFKKNLKKNRKKLLYKWFADLIICPSDFAREDLKKYFQCKNSVKILNPMRDRFSGKIVMDSNFIVISYLGRLEPSKGIIELINAFLAYKKKFQMSKIILNIAGSGSQYDQVLKLCNVNTDINFQGALSYNEIDQYLNKSHYTIIPSKFDNLPTVGLESMMNHTPLLISNNTGLTKELKDEIDCFKFNPTLEGMISLFENVENNFDNHINMGIEARKTYLKKFGTDSYCTVMKKIIETLSVIK